MADRGPKWFWNALGGTGSIEGKFVRQKTSTRKIAEIEFQSEQWGKTVKTFETFIKPYEEAMLLYSALPFFKSATRRSHVSELDDWVHD